MSVSPSARASWMLVAVTLLWGASFSLTHAWQKAPENTADKLVSGLTLIGLRMPLALVVLAVWQPRVVFGVNRTEFAAGFLIGTIFFAGFALQTWGLASTTPALSAFFTSVCSAWVPLLCWLAFRERPRLLTLAGLSVGLVGCAVLVEGWNLSFGDWLTLGASLLFAVQVLVLDYVGKRVNPAHISVGFLVATGSFSLLGAALAASFGDGLGAWAVWMGDMLAVPKLAWSVVALATLATAVAFHWMNSYQPLVPANRAALIYLLEAVFSAVFSVLLGYDPLTWALILGGALIIVGNVLVELPGWLSVRPK